MITRLQRPPARIVPRERLQGPSNRQSFGAVDQHKDASFHRGDLSGIQLPVTIGTPYIQQINPVPEVPKLINYSAAQPVTIWGWRRYTRTHMSAGPRFLGRWVAVGAIIRAYTERGRMTGVATRQGVTYSVPRYKVSPGTRTIPLGGGS